MKIQIKKPITPSQRNLVKIKSNISKKPALLKNQFRNLKNYAGRNNSGKITVFHQGGGCKKRYRKIDFYRTDDSTAIITSVEYDPYRTAYIASSYNYLRKSYSYIIAPAGIKVGDIIKSGPNSEIKLGHSLPLSKIPVGSLLYNVALKPNKQSKISRSAGTFSFLIEKLADESRIKINSNTYKRIPVDCYASLGTVSNELHFVQTLGKAGRSRWLNTRPTVRGVAMNPVDHPHGGGEGKKSGKNLTPWGKHNFTKSKR